MYKQIAMPKENKNQSITNTVSQKKSVGESKFQIVDNRPEAIVQRKLQGYTNSSPQAKRSTQLPDMADNYSAQQQPIQTKKNNTGMPGSLKSGIEYLSGLSLDDVKVHRNSDKPAQLQAHAYAQGTNIHLGPGQEKHLPHEAWHVVQQRQERVKPTLQVKGEINLNDDAGLEKEADVMGARASQLIPTEITEYNDLNTESRNSSIVQKVDKRGNLSDSERKFLLEIYDKDDKLKSLTYWSEEDDRRQIKFSGSLKSKRTTLNSILAKSTNYSSSSLTGLLTKFGYGKSSSSSTSVTEPSATFSTLKDAVDIYTAQEDHLHTSSVVPKGPKVPAFKSIGSHQINGFPVNAKALMEISKFISSFDINTTRSEDRHLTELTHYKPHDLRASNFTHTTSVIDTADRHKEYFSSIQEQLYKEANYAKGLAGLFKSLNSMERSYGGLRLDRSGTTIKIVHYGRDEDTLLRTTVEKEQEPYLSTKLLTESPDFLSKYLDCSSYVKSLAKLGITAGMTNKQITEKLSGYKHRAKLVQSDNASTSEERIVSKEAQIAEHERLLVTHKGISKGLPLITEMPSSKYDEEKYSIHNFDSMDQEKATRLSKKRSKEVSSFWERAENGEGKILLWGYAIAGFGDLGNFQMLYKSIVSRNPDIKDRLEPYVCFYRYSIPDSTIKDLLDSNINVVTHESANRQWDPNYGYEVSQSVMPTDPEFEIQYNVGSVYNTAIPKNVLRVGEMGGMAGVSQVEDAHFTGTTRGGIGYGIPEDQKPEENSATTSFAAKLHSAVTGDDIREDQSIDAIAAHYGLMMARENSQIVNQRPYYNTDEIDKAELRNVSVGNRSLALILKSMISLNSSSNPIVITTGNIKGLMGAAKDVGLKIEEPTKASVNVGDSSNPVVKTFENYQVSAGGKSCNIVKGIFPNNYLHLLMKFASVPTVYSGEGSMNEGMAYGKPGFMIPFYDFQVTLLLESGGISKKYLNDPSNYVLNGKRVYVTNKSIWNLTPFDLMKIEFPGEEEQLYLVMAISKYRMVVKKMDKTEQTFDILYHNYSSTSNKLGVVTYEMKGWAKEWLNLIYGRGQSSIDVREMGKQAEAIKGPNWFDLFNLKKITRTGTTK